jgi:FolB domain-containing protein
VNDVVEVRDLRVSAVIGALESERGAPQPLSLDIDIFRPFIGAARGDDLGATTNYADVIELVVALAQNGRYQLLETLAVSAGESILDSDLSINKVTVAVRKLEPPVPENVATVGVRCTLERRT